MSLQRLHEIMPLMRGALQMQSDVLGNQQLEQKIRDMTDPASDENALMKARVRNENASADSSEYQNAHRDELLKAKLEEMNLSGVAGATHGLSYLMPDARTGEDPGREAILRILMERGLYKPRPPMSTDDRMRQQGFSDEQIQKFHGSGKVTPKH